MPRVNLEAFTPQQRQALAGLMLNYINDEVVGRHVHDWHHTHSEAFFLNHRSYIQGMEQFLVLNGGLQFVPLPKWDPATPIPQEFQAVKPHDDGSARPALINTNPNRRVPSGILKPAACSLSADAQATQTEGWHDDVHDTIGGAMKTFEDAPAAVIFWCWHAFVDDLYEDWRNCPKDAVADPAAYVTNFPGQGPVARVVYPGTDQHVHELALRDGSPFSFADLTDLGGAGRPAGRPSAYVTDFPGQGPVARVVYRRTNNHIIELYMFASTLAWDSADLSDLTAAPDAAGDPVGYLTNFPGQGPTARVVYRATNGHIFELSHSGGSWKQTDLIPFA